MAQRTTPHLGQALGDGFVLHIPHAAVEIPLRERPSFLLDDAALAGEILRMTDAFTDELVEGALPAAAHVRFPVSRLLVDPERFEDDERESMSRVGMGVLYERGSDGREIRTKPSPEDRERLLATWYRPHHIRLTEAVQSAIEHHGACVLLDIHSFPSVPLPYEPVQDPVRPDICLGTDEFHTPASLVELAERLFRDEGLRVERNRPFGGAMMPAAFLGPEPRASNLMIEVNRGLYMDEATGRRTTNFDRTRLTLARVLRAVARMQR